MTKDAAALARGHEIFDPIAQTYLGRDGVDVGRMFASEGLRIRGKNFAFLGFEGDLMLKLPAARTTELVDAGDAERVVMRGRADAGVGLRADRQSATVGNRSSPRPSRISTRSLPSPVAG
jgi:hypothetical protein